MRGWTCSWNEGEEKRTHKFMRNFFEISNFESQYREGT
jgi:hypothetical protein